MALINHEKKEINVKIVFYGPGSSGKTTNIKFLYEKMKPEFRGKLKFMNTGTGKMLFFDFKRPDQIGIQDYDIRFHVYTVQGEVADYGIWKTVLKGMDGLVFAADSDPYRMPDNLQYFEKLTEYLETLGKDIKDIPCLLQCNKQDIPDATSIEEMKELLHSIDCPVIPASAAKGEGVLSTLSNIVRIVLQKLREMPLEGAKEQLGEPGEAEAAVPPEARREELSAEAMPVAENILSAPLTDTSIEQESESGSLLETLERAEPELEPEVKPSEPGEITAHYGGTAEEIHEATVEPLSTREEQAAFEQPPAFVSFGEPASEEARQLPEAETLTPLEEISEPEAIAADIDFAGEVEQVAPGHLRLPITVRYGQDTKKITLNLKISLEPASN